MQFLALAALLSLVSTNPVFETGGILDEWDVLDYKGDARVEQVTVTDCPPGYGPEVIRLSGTLALLLAKGEHLGDGTYIALYRERAAATQDADGVILFGGAFGDDLSLEHNTKTMRPHLWLEQDNDTGISFRYQPAEGEDHSIKESVAVGLVTDPWNVTGWIWQKVQVEGTMVRAKYWPAHEGEPDAWQVETTSELPGDRFGIRINSGEIDLAYFSADTVDFTRPAPDYYLHLPRSTVAVGDALSLMLFTGNKAEEMGGAPYVIEGGGGRIPGRLEIPAGGGAVTLDLPDDMVEGKYTLNVTAAPGGKALTRTFRVAAESEAAVTLRARNALLKGLAPHAEISPPISEVFQVATALLDLAQRYYDQGENDRAKETLRFVDETLAELHGPAGDALRAADVNFDWTTVPSEYDGNTGVGSPDQGTQDHYRATSRIRFGKLYGASSAVMGHDLRVDIPFEAIGASPDTDYTIHIALKDPLGIRTVAEATITPNPPTSQWVPGRGYLQQATLHISRDDTQKGVSQPVVLDEMHDLLVSVRDEATGAHVLLDNSAGHHPNRVGQGYVAKQVYVSSASIEIHGGGIQNRDDGDELCIGIRNHGPAMAVKVLFRILALSGVPIAEYAQDLEFPESPPGGTRGMARIHTGKKIRGGAVADVSIYGETGLLTRMNAPMPGENLEENAPAFTRANHVASLGNAATQSDANKLPSLEGPGVGQTSPDDQIPPLTPPGRGIAEQAPFGSRSHQDSEVGLRTPIHFSPGGWTEPIDVTVQAKGEILCRYTDLTEPTTLYPPPHFGYYDITATSGDTSWHECIVATVVETRGGQLLVNGEPFIVKGVNVHAMDSRSPARTRFMMDILKDLGFNSLRGDYPPRWQIDMAHEAGLTYDVLAPFSVSSTAEIFARQDGPPLATARAVTRQFIARYADAAAVLLWNSANEIVDENIPFLLAQHPLYKIHDPYQRPVHYANLYGQDLWQGQDVMGVNYYFSDTQKAVDRQPLIMRSAAIAREHGLPMIYTEFNSYHGAVPTTGVEAMEDLFTWGVETAGMAGGYFYMMPDSDRHPGVFDGGYNTHRIMDDAFHRAFDDGRVRVVVSTETTATLEIENLRPFALRAVGLELSALGRSLDVPAISDMAPGETTQLVITLPTEISGRALTLTGTLIFETHHGLVSRVPVRLVVERV